MYTKTTRLFASLVDNYSLSLSEALKVLGNLTISTARHSNVNVIAFIIRIPKVAHWWGGGLLIEHPGVAPHLLKLRCCTVTNISGWHQALWSWMPLTDKKKTYTNHWHPQVRYNLLTRPYGARREWYLHHGVNWATMPFRGAAENFVFF